MLALEDEGETWWQNQVDQSPEVVATLEAVEKGFIANFELHRMKNRDYIVLAQ